VSPSPRPVTREIKRHQADFSQVPQRILEARLFKISVQFDF